MLSLCNMYISMSIYIYVCVCAFDVVKSSLKVVQFEGMTFCQRFQKYLDSTTSPSLTHTYIQWKHTMEKERDPRGKSKSACS